MQLEILRCHIGTSKKLSRIVITSESLRSRIASLKTRGFYGEENRIIVTNRKDYIKDISSARGKVLIDRDLAELYGAETRVLKQAVKRNFNRFPSDFMFKLNKEEFKNWRSQFVTSNSDKMGLRYAPLAFTEQGVAMLSSVLYSERAVQVNIAIMRAFVQMRKFLQSSDALAKKLKELEKETKKKFAKQQEQIKFIFEAIKELMIEKTKPKRKIGF